MYVCVFVCLFVCLFACSVTFDPNNATFTQKIDDYMGGVMNCSSTEKSLKMCSVAMKNYILFTGD